MPSSESPGATYYASPDGGGDGRSSSSPFHIADFWRVASPGDSLLLLDGRYVGAGSMIQPPEGLSGTPDRPITVRAANDGQAEIDGEAQRVPVHFRRNDHFALEGVNAHHGSREVVALYHSNHNAVRRICAWEAGDHNNGNCFAVHYGEHNLFEDCAGWGTSRKVFTNSQGGNHTTYRRCWGRWEGCHVVGPKMTYSLFYNSHHILAENCIGTWDARRMVETHVVLRNDGRAPYVSSRGSRRYYHPLTIAGYGVDQPYGIFAMDANNKYGWDQTTIGPSVYGCIAYTLPAQKLDRFIGLYFVKSTAPDDGYLENCLALRSPGSQGSVGSMFSLTNCRGRSLTAVGECDRGSGTPGFESVVELADGPGAPANGRDCGVARYLHRDWRMIPGVFDPS